MSETKVCSLCGVEKSLTEFPKNGRFKDGSTRYRPECKTCYNAMRKANKKRFNKFKSNSKVRTGEVDTITFEDWKKALQHFEGKCCYCGETPTRRNKLTKEHLVPVSAGGKTCRSNIAPACSRCNSSKQNEPLETWYRRQSFFSEERLQKIKRWVEDMNE